MIVETIVRKRGYRVSRQDQNPPSQPSTRDRVDLRADPAWVARIERQAERLGISVSAYIRLATTKQLEADEASDPSAE